MANADLLEGDVVFSQPTDVLIWASRTYLYNVMQHRPIPAVLESTFREAKLDSLFEALMTVLWVLRASALRPLPVHEPTCPCVADYERALIAGWRCLQANDEASYMQAMAGILVPANAAMICNEMRHIARELSRIERFWPDADMPAQYPASVAAQTTNRLH
ncbi:MAG: hypothetical protein AAFN78_19835 [Pseudomonadota bacterium]